MSRIREMAAVRKQAAHKLKEGGFRNRDIAWLLGVSEAHTSILLKEPSPAAFPFVFVEEKQEVQVEKETDPRTLRMVQLYKDGKTLEEVGHEFGVTRERARQLIRPFVTRLEGGKSRAAQEQALQRLADKRAHREAKCQDMLGCDYETGIRLNRGQPIRYNNGSLAAAYLDQKRTMTGTYVGVKYTLTFPEWIEAWGPRIHMRSQGKYGLCRIDPALGFVPGNVRVEAIKDNAQKTIRRTKDRMARIRSMFEAGMSQEQIAQDLGVTPQYIASLRWYERRMGA